MYSSKCNH